MDTGVRSLQELSRLALDLLSRCGTRDLNSCWETTVRSVNGNELRITCQGADLPSGVPSEIATPNRIMEQRPFVGSYRLIIRVPLVVFDIYWNPGEPLRIMNFSRGDWEDELASAA